MICGCGCHLAGEELEDVLRVAVERSGDVLEVVDYRTHANGVDVEDGQLEAFTFRGNLGYLLATAFEEVVVIVLHGNRQWKKRRQAI